MQGRERDDGTSYDLSHADRGQKDGLVMLAPFATVITLITLRDYGVKPPGANWNGKGNLIGPFPAPGDYLAAMVLFAPLFALSDTQNAHTFAELLGWAFALSIYMGAVNPSTPLSKSTTPGMSTTTTTKT